MHSGLLPAVVFASVVPGGAILGGRSPGEGLIDPFRHFAARRNRLPVHGGVSPCQLPSTDSSAGGPV